jgi:hypothetical protein
VSLTRAAWERCITVPTGIVGQDEASRVWDVLGMLACAVRLGGAREEVSFAVHVRNDNRERTPPLVRLKALCGPGGDAAQSRNAIQFAASRREGRGGTRRGPEGEQTICLLTPAVWCQASLTDCP